MTKRPRKQVAVFSRILAVFVMTSMLWSQTAAVAQTPVTAQAPAAPTVAAPSEQAPTEQAPAEKHTEPATLTIPAGTAVPLTMITEIHKAAMKTGGPVRAEVMFPVTVGNHIAIPVGTFVEGTIAPVPSNTKAQGVFALIQFTQLTFANGYKVPLSANAESAMLVMPQNSAAGADDSAYAGGARLVEATYSPDENAGARFVQAGQSCPIPSQCQPAPLPREGPNPVTVTLGILGGFFALLAGLLIFAHHERAKADDLLMANGTQLQMTLQQPVTLDTAQVAAAATTGTI